jgi:hypothetical protein
MKKHLLKFTTSKFSETNFTVIRKYHDIHIRSHRPQCMTDLKGGGVSMSRRRVEEGNLHWRPESNPNFLVFQLSSVDIVTRSRDCQTIMVWFPAEANIQTGFTANSGPTEWVGKAALTLKVKRQAHIGDNSSPSSAEVKNERSYTSIPPYFILACSG